MSKDLSRFLTKEYMKKLNALKTGAKVRVLKFADTDNELVVGQVYEVEQRGESDEFGTLIARRSSIGQTKWFRLKNYSGYFIGSDAYVFQIVNEDDRIAYEPWNKPSV